MKEHIENNGGIKEVPMSQPVVGIVMGSESDAEVMQNAAEVLDSLGVPYAITVASAHRAIDKTLGYAREAAKLGLKVIIAGAGGAAHLPGVVAAATTLPIIGVPIDSSPLKGMDALLSIAQMPSGVPVATMAVGAAGAKNAAYLAVRILALQDRELKARLEDHISRMAEEVEASDRRIKDKRA
jgi:phosphoribosylaminoimidazole carboxylase PurE protein